jgi:hypothetical protein
MHWLECLLKKINKNKNKNKRKEKKRKEKKKNLLYEVHNVGLHMLFLCSPWL